MSFEEKSAWGSLFALAFASWLFFPDAFAHLNAGGHPLALTGKAIFVVGVIIVIEIVYHVLLALTSKNLDADERDRQITLKADSYSGYVLGIGIFIVIGHIITSGVVPDATSELSNAMIAVYLLLALTVSEVSKLLWQVWYYRKGV